MSIDCMKSPLTPPLSQADSPTEDEPQTTVSISTTFYPGARDDPDPADLTLLTCDSVFFSVHRQVLLRASANQFDGLLTHLAAGEFIGISETSPIINVVLHAIYDLSPAHYSPNLHTLIGALEAIKKYDLPLHTYVAPGKPLFNILLGQAADHPVDVYALASSFDLHDLAVSCSPFLLSQPLSAISDTQCLTMGPIYLKKLFYLHLGRTAALKRLLLVPPESHLPTPTCGEAEYKSLLRAWSLATAYLAWDSRPDTSVGELESALDPLAQHVSCHLCRTSLRERIRTLVVEWTSVKRTIQ